MANPPQYQSLADMDSSSWLVNIKEQFKFDQWPSECIRCRQTEQINNTSIRLNTIKDHQHRSRPDYLVVGGVLDNICNSACQMCNKEYSTRIGSLEGKQFPVVDNSKHFWSLPQERITHLDLNGGEPSYSKNYRYVLNNLPANVKSIRLNTNCSSVLTELLPLVDRGVDVTVTVSFDGIELVHDYIRWPVKWDTFYNNLMTYRKMPIKLNLWTTVSALNINNLDSMIEFARTNDINHSWALLDHPHELSIVYQNRLTLSAVTDIPGIKQYLATKENNQGMFDTYIAQQDQLRNISISDYLQ